MRGPRSSWLRASLTLLVVLSGLAAVASGAAPGSSFGTPRRLLTGLSQVWAAATGGTVWVAKQSVQGPTELVALDARSGALRARRAPARWEGCQARSAS